MVIDCLKKKIMKKIIIITIVSLIVVGAAYLIFKKPNEADIMEDTPLDNFGDEVSIVEKDTQSINDDLVSGNQNNGDPGTGDGTSEFTFAGDSNNSNNRP